MKITNSFKPVTKQGGSLASRQITYVSDLGSAGWVEVVGVGCTGVRWGTANSMAG